EQAASNDNRPPDDFELPEHLRDRPTGRHLWDFPTAWLLGTRLIASLRDIVLSAVLHLELRDWMNAGEPIDLRNAIVPAAGAAGAAGKESAGCWIDYLSDTGDSARLVWQLAYLLQQPSLEVHVSDADQDRLVAHD